MRFKDDIFWWHQWYLVPRICCRHYFHLYSVMLFPSPLQSLKHFFARSYLAIIPAMVEDLTERGRDNCCGEGLCNHDSACCGHVQLEGWFSFLLHTSYDVQQFLVAPYYSVASYFCHDFEVKTILVQRRKRWWCAPSPCSQWPNYIKHAPWSCTLFFCWWISIPKLGWWGIM